LLLRAALSAIFAGRSLDQWVTDLADVDTCFAPVNSLEEAMRDPQARALGMFPELDGLPQIGVPISLSDTPAQLRRKPPRLGEHTAEVLAELGVDGTALASLHEQGVIGGLAP
jgi:crotonobetainyl-CoA:carnitine CoA-transferase CaiB-like acyl-CoA transferase